MKNEKNRISKQTKKATKKVRVQTTYYSPKDKIFVSEKEATFYFAEMD
jgi:hypothetical protein